MKTKIISALLLAFTSISYGCLAQSPSVKKAGIKGGLNVSNLYIDDLNDENARIGFNAGLYGQVLSGDVAALQLELLYATKGARAFYDGPINQEVRYNLNYLDLPVMGIIKIGKTLEVQVGGYASYLLTANIDYNGDIINGTDEVDKDQLKSYDYGLSGGLGFNFGAVQVGARYNYGLVKIADSDGARAIIGDSKNSNAQLFVAFNLLQ